MRDWTKVFRSQENVSRLNGNLASALAHCYHLNSGGWKFRCVECHISTGTYSFGYIGDWHSHNEYQIEIALSGIFEFFTRNSERIVIRPVDTLVIPWKQAHRWKCIKPGVMIGISLDLLPTPESIRKNGWLVDDINKITSAAIKMRAYDLIKHSLMGGDPSLRAKISAAHLFLLLAAIMERMMSSKLGHDSKANERATEMRGRDVIGWVARYLEQNLGADLSLQQIAREVGLSSRQVHRLFLKYVGNSPHDYLLRHRLEEARRLLMEKGRKMQVKEIAFSCGFNSLSYFSNAFKRVYGVSPSRMLLPNVALKSGTTFQMYSDPSEAPSLSLPAKKRASASAAKKARG